jgi:hypothetical protein
VGQRNIENSYGRTTIVNEYWCAFYADLSAFAVFDRELDALRYAVENHMDCRPVKINCDLREQLK